MCGSLDTPSAGRAVQLAMLGSAGSSKQDGAGKADDDAGESADVPPEGRLDEPADAADSDDWQDQWPMRAQIERGLTESLSPKRQPSTRWRHGSWCPLGPDPSASVKEQSDAEAAEDPDEDASPLDSGREAWNTIIMFDWDDTLCPSAYIWGDKRMRWDQVAPCFDGDTSIPATPATARKSEAGQSWTMLELLTAHAAVVANLLRLACGLGKVAIVTLAQDGWVHTSIAHFMPSLTGLLEELDIQVVYARSTIPPRFLRQAHEEGQSVAKVLKTRAMSQTIKKFYGAGKKHVAERSWKNVLSIGDSAAERHAVQDVVLRRVQPKGPAGRSDLCLCKSLKMLAEPTLRRLTAELQIVCAWLRTVVLHDGDVDLDFDELLDEDSPLPPGRASHDLEGTRGCSTGAADGPRAGCVDLPACKDHHWAMQVS